MVDLKRMRELMAKMPEILWKVECAAADATRVTTNITGMPRGGSMNRQEDSYITLADVTEAYREAKTELDAMRAELAPMVDAMEDVKGRAFIRMRYLQGHSLAEIAEAEKMDRTTVWRIIDHAETALIRRQNL